ncbi:type VI secretion system Vgr family protein [Sorangium sp. So ce426]|uniref:type VI secretion system Vgr family protein n=1 Tax=unclassified Sorangium TaxID=2621164 RepID=UPI003F5AED4D
MMMEFDFTLALEGAGGPGGPWGCFQVVSFRGHEEISALSRYELTLLAKGPVPEVDPFELIGKRATLRLKTLTTPDFRVVHGIIAEAEEMSSLPGGMLYRLVLVSPLARGLYRRRCRIFLDKTTREIIDAVLQGDPNLVKADGATAPPDDGDFSSFSPAAEQYTWRVTNSPRIDQASARPYCVQYNESDFAFFSRLLEEEGIGYHYENGGQTCLLVLSDRDAGRTPGGAPIGPDLPGRELSVLRLGGRLRARSVSLDDYDWHKPALPMLARAGSGDLSEYSYPGGYTDAPSQGEPLATALVDRYAVEASYATGEGHVRTLSAGSLVSIVDARSTHEGDYLITKLEVRGEQSGVIQHLPAAAGDVPLRCRFEAARRRDGESRFRPARVTPRPRIQGSQTAFVTSAPEAPGATVHVGDLVGCVRLKFHWDHEEARLAKEPSSCWVRVSQTFAGGGEGAVWHPRVGVEVIVEFLEGDPDRPIVTGRVYNGAKMPPAPSVGAPTISTIKSLSVPGGAQYNEILFDDAAGSEQIKVHAAKDWSTVVENDRSEFVKHDSTSTVGVNRTEATGANRSTTVGADNSEMVGANESITIGESRSIFVGGNQATTIDGWQSIDIMNGVQEIKVHTGDQRVDVKGSQDVTVQGEKQWFHITGTQDFDVGGSIQYAAEEQSGLSSKLGQSLSDGTKQTFTAPWQDFKAVVTEYSSLRKQEFSSNDFVVNADKTVSIHAQEQRVTIDSAEGTVSVDGKTLLHLGSVTQIEITGGNISISGGDINVAGGNVVIAGESGGVAVSGPTVSLAGGSTEVHGDLAVEVTAAVIKLN